MGLNGIDALGHGLLSTTDLLAALPYGGYVAWWAVPILLVVLLVWLRLLTWIDKDIPKMAMKREPINGGLMAGLVLAIAIFFIVPGGFLLGLLALLVIFAIEMGVYLGLRSQKIGLADLKDELINEFKFLKVGGGGGKKGSKDDELVTDITLVAKGGAHVTRPDEESPQRPGFDALMQALTEPFQKKAQTVEIVPAADGSLTRYWIDGVSYDGVKYDKAVAGEAIAFLKQAAGLDSGEKRKPQNGAMKALSSHGKHELRLQTAGSSAGETVRIEIDVPKRYQMKVEELGFTSEQITALRERMAEGGVVLLACPKGHGLTSLEYGMIRMHDAFTSHILTIERDPPIEMEGITATKLTAGTPPAEEQQKVEWVCSQLPDVIMVGPLEAQGSARSLLKFADDGRRAYVGIRASSVLEAIDGWRKLVGDDSLALGNLKYVVAGRLFRRLCDATKIPYVPEESKLKQLGMAGRVAELYKPNFGPLRDARGNEIPDTFCFNLGYSGRFGVYESLSVDDEVRQIYKEGGSQTALRAAFRKQKKRFIQEIALARVEAGDTSVDEFIRVLKPGGGSSSTPPTAVKPKA
jgi:type II secretory ATPase GspE/PulE/Tfp pilus assembly ATPase PilB-like protein